MLLIENKRKVVFAPENTQQVLEAIPHARAFEHKGQELVAVHHGVDERIVLRNFGLDVPPPILHYYDWPARNITARTHQKHTAAFLTNYRLALCLNAPGTGKTLSALWAADFLMREGIIKRVLVIAPKSTLLSVWGKELKHHFPFRSFTILTGTKERRQRLLDQPTDFCVINHDGFTAFHAQLQGLFDLVLYDEGTALKTPSSQRFRIFHKWMQANAAWLWLFTGTPISQSPTDAWTLAKLVRSPTVPKSFTTFRDMVLDKVSMFKWVPRKDALDVCKRVLQPSIRYSLEECIDLPPMNYVNRECDMTPAQVRAFKAMQEKAIAIFSNTTVVAANAAVVLGKLLQIVGGVIYDNDGERIHIDAEPRLEALIELMEEIGDKGVIYVPLRGAQDWLYKRLTEKKWKVAMVHGGVSQKERHRIFSEFQEGTEINWMLAHPRVAAHGLDFTRAPASIWYMPVHSMEQYEQANARIRRLTTKGSTTIFQLYATPFERELYRRLQYRKKVLTDFLNLVHGENVDD